MSPISFVLLMRKFVEIQIDLHKSVSLDMQQRRSRLEKAKFSHSAAAEFVPRSVESWAQTSHTSPEYLLPVACKACLSDANNSLAEIISVSLELPDLNLAELFSSPYMTLGVSTCRDTQTARIPRLSTLLHWASIEHTDLRIDE